MAGAMRQRRPPRRWYVLALGAFVSVEVLTGVRNGSVWNDRRTCIRGKTLWPGGASLTHKRKVAGSLGPA